LRNNVIRNAEASKGSGHNLENYLKNKQIGTNTVR
jgi:hypothetical protein